MRDIWRMSRALSDARLDLVLFPTIYSYVPVLGRAKKIVMIHDVIAEKFPRLTLPTRSARFFWNVKTALGRRQADAIVTVSDYSRQHIVKQFNLAPERVFVVGEASDPVFCVLDHPEPTPHLRSLGITCGARLLIYVGGFGPHKNLESLVTVLASLSAEPQFSDLKLVMVGEHDDEVFYSDFHAIKQQIQDLNLAERVIITGYLPDQELVLLLNLGTALVLPSLMEGFGLPAVEAAACGCPVIATAESPLPRLLGEGGIYFEPLNHRDLERALRSVLESEDLRQRMRTAGMAAARRLTWDAAAGELLQVMRKVGAR